MLKIILTKGLPASGKTTWSKELAKNSNGKIARITKDELRPIFVNQKNIERSVIELRNKMTTDYLDKGISVIWEDTNFNPIHENKANEIIKNYNGAEVEIKDFTDVDYELCIERDRLRPNSVGKKVIMDMFTKFLKPEYKENINLPKAILVDIDGTIAKINNRRPYEWDKVINDLPHNDVINLVTMLQKNGYKVIFMSGRDSVCREQTQEWIKINTKDSGLKTEDTELYMRSINDVRPDTTVKQELFEAHIRSKYYISYVIDDRNSVVEMWRNRLGLRVLQVQEGDF
jgi:predicted kinase